MHTITLTRDNIENADNNRMVYDIPGSKALEGAQIALSNLYMYYSWQNINSAPLNNNKLRIVWPALTEDNAGNPITQAATSIEITIPDGLYEVADINAFFEQFCITNNLYLINSTTGQYVYFIQMQVNPTRYAVQFKSFSLPATAAVLGTTYTEPPGGFCNSPLLAGVGALGGFPGVAGSAPGWQFPGNFSAWAGFENNYANPPGSVVALGSTSYFTGLGAFPTGNTSFLSTITPNVQPNSVIFVNCNLITNPYPNPSTFLYPIPAKSGIGALIQVEAPEYSWNQMLPGVANKVIITFTDQTGQPIKIQDPNIIVSLIIRDHDSKQAKIAASGPGGVSKSMETLRYGHNPQNGAVDAQHYNQTNLMHRRTQY